MTDDTTTDLETDQVFDLTEDDSEEIEDAPVHPWNLPGQWFVVHTQAGYEKKVSANLAARIQSMNMEDKIFDVVIPMEEVVEFKGGRKQVVQKKVFPGYILVRCHMDDESWYCIRNTPGITGFVGQSQKGQKPTPLSRREVDTFLSAKGDGQETAARRKPKLERAREGRPVRRLLGSSRRDQRGPHEAQGAGEHLRSRDHGRDGLQPGRETLIRISLRKATPHGEEETHSDRQDPDPGR
jgi:transcriptional antiterminator NusG